MRKLKPVNPDFASSVLHYLEAAMRDRDYQAVIEHFDRHKGELDIAQDATVAEILRLVARAQASSKEFKKALHTIRTAQRKASSSGDSILMAEVLMTLGSVLCDLGQSKEAIRTYSDAESIFRRQDSLGGRGRALNQLAGICFKANDYKRCLELLLEAAEIATERSDSKSLAYLMGNIGRVYTFMGRLGEAEKHLLINIDLSTEFEDVSHTATALLSLGYVQMQKGDYAVSEATLTKASELIAEINDSRSEVIYLTYLGELQYRDGRYDSSLKSLERALTQAKQFGSDSTLAGRVMRHLAELHVRTENYRLAQKFVSAALVIYRKSSDKVEQGALKKIRFQIEAHNGNFEKAKEVLDDCLHNLEEAKVAFELVDALLTAAECEQLSDRERSRYVFRAERLITRRGPHDRIERIIASISGGRTESAPESDSQSCSGFRCEDIFITASSELTKTKSQLPALGKADLPILLTGETGVGKDVMARYFHLLVRPGKPYIAINCASLPPTLLESELFGYRKGAFTGADQDKQGLFVAANSGVLFLDEIGEMDQSLQAKLLGVLERRKVNPLGGITEIDLDIKLVAATNRDLEGMVADGLFRRDLYYRLSGITLELPPLRERKEDIPLLLTHFLRQHNLLSEDERPDEAIVRQFVAYDWPGNVRELVNRVKRLEAMSFMAADNDLAELVGLLFSDSTSVSEEERSLFDRVEEFERKLITEALIASSGNKSRTARLLGVHEATVRTKLKRYGIESAMNLKADPIFRPN